jgi:hypothetical protein
LVGLGPALGVEDIDRDAALGHDAGALAELGDRRIPLAALRHGNFQGVESHRRPGTQKHRSSQSHNHR